MHVQNKIKLAAKADDCHSKFCVAYEFERTSEVSTIGKTGGK